MVVILRNPRYIRGMTPAQCRAARGLLNWTQSDLADRAGVAATTVRNFENGASIQRASLAVISGALETAGVEFIADGAASQDGGAGVRLRKRS